MADRKITDLTALAAGSQATGDLLTIVDVSEAAATDKNKKITVESLFKGIPGDVGIGTTSPTGYIHIQGASTGTETYGRFTTGSANGDQSLVIKSGSSRDHMAIQVATNAGVNDDLSLQPDGGNVGIGTSSPTTKLEINGGTDNNIVRIVSTDANANIEFADNNTTSGCQIGANGDNLKFGISGTESMRIDSSGRLLLGTTTEGEGSADNLTIEDSGNCGITLRSGTGNAGGIYFSDATSGGGEYDGLIAYHQGNRFLQFWTAQSERMRIDSSGRLLVGTSTARANFVVGLGSNTVPAAGAATASALFSNGTGAGDYGLIAGATSSGHGYLQAQRADGIATTYNLLVQPNGGNVGIGTSSPRSKTEVYDSAVSGAFSATDLSTWRVLQVRNNIEQNTGTAAGIALGGDGTSDTETAGIVAISDNSTGGVCQLAFLYASGNVSKEGMRIDSSGRVLIGTTSNQGGHLFQVKGGDVSLTKLAEASGGNDVHMLRFRVHNSNNTAQDASLAGISAETVSGWGGSLTFHTKPANGSPNESVTERARLDNDGRFQVPGRGINVAASQDISFSNYGFSGGGGTDGVLARHSGNAYFSVDDFFRIRDNINTSENKEFEFNTNSGSAGADNNWNSNNFDFAEMFEWSDGNPNAEDRIGYSVAVDGLTGKIKIAEEGDVPIGIVSGTASFVANAGELQWAGRRQRDEWGRFVYEPAVTVDDEGNEVPLLDDEGNQRTKPAINPDWDEARFNSYVPRSQRPEWACIGVIGQVYMRKNCPVDARWIKLKEVDSVKDLWLIR